VSIASLTFKLQCFSKTLCYQLQARYLIAHKDLLTEQQAARLGRQNGYAFTLNPTVVSMGWASANHVGTMYGSTLKDIIVLVHTLTVLI